MFDRLIKSILLYRAEIWGWKEYESMERCQNKYIKWSLELDWNTPSHIVREKAKKFVMRIESGQKALKFEEKIRGESNNELLEKCLVEIEKEKQTAEGESGSHQVRNRQRKYFRKNGMSGIEVEKNEGRKEPRDTIGSLIERDIKFQKQTQFNRIQNSKYAKRCKNLNFY